VTCVGVTNIFCEGDSYSFPFCENMFVRGKSPVKVQRQILDIIFLGELYVLYMELGARFFSYGECDVDRFGSASFYFPFLN
jgi:hypothetical protein